MHGGAVGSGRQVIHGRRWSVLPTRLKTCFEAAMADPKLIELQEDLALVESLIEETCSAMSENSSAEWWQSAKDAFEDFKRAGVKRDQKTMETSLAQLDACLSNGYGLAQKEEKLLGLIERRRKIVETEARRIRDAQSFLAEREVMALITALVAAVQRRIQDPKVLHLLVDDFNRLLAPALPSQAASRSES